MKRYYHATTKENAHKIEKEGFHLGMSGMFGGGIYFAEKPMNAKMKAHVNNCNSIIIAILDVGRLMTEEKAHNNWNLNIIKSKGYDSVQMTHCRTGAEICLYEPWRVQIIAIVEWDNYNIVFKFFNSNESDINFNDFRELINGKCVKYENHELQQHKNTSCYQNKNKESQFNQLIELEKAMSHEEKMYYKQHSHKMFSNYNKPRIDILYDYLNMQNQLRQCYPEMKSKLDDRINYLLNILKQENSRIARENQLIAELMRGIGTASKPTCAPKMISEIEKFKKNNNIY